MRSWNDCPSEPGWGTVRLAQLALTILFSTYAVSELLKFCELGAKRFETLSKKSRRILRSNAGIHYTLLIESPGEFAHSRDREKYAIT